MFKKISKIIGYACIAAIFTIALSGCGKTVAPTTNKVVVWSFEDADVWKPVIQRFQAKYKNYTVTYEKQTLDSGYENRVLNSMLSNGTPDVWSMPNDWVYRHKDQLSPMPDQTAKTVDLASQFVPSIKQSVYFDNKIYALSPSAEPLMIYYNPKIFSDTLNSIIDGSKDPDFNRRASALLQEPPKTWSDFNEAVKLLTKKTGVAITQSGVAMGTSRITNSNDILYLLMLQNETDILSGDYSLSTFNLPKNTSTGANDIPGKRALEFYTSYANPASSDYSWSDSLGIDTEAFGAGKVAMVFGYSGLQNTLLQKYPNLKYRKAYVPQVYIDSNKIKDYARFNAFGVNKLSKNPAAGWALVNSLVNDSGDDFVSGARLYTSKKAGTYDISVNQRTGSNPEKLELATAASLVKGRFPEDFDIYIRSAVDAVNAGNQNSRAALDLAADKITDLLRKKGW